MNQIHENSCNLVLFHLADFPVNLFPVINRNHEYNYMLIPVNPLVNHGNWGGSWGLLTL